MHKVQQKYLHFMGYTLFPWEKQNDHNFIDDIFKYISMKETFWILIVISLKFVIECQNYDKSA